MTWLAALACVLVIPATVAPTPVELPPSAPAGDLPPGGAEPPWLTAAADQTHNWLAWRPRPEYGPGSEDRQGWRLLHWRVDSMDLELRVGYERVTRKTAEVIAEAQETFDYPITPVNLKLPGEEKDADFDPTVWAADVIKWYRLVYLVVSFP